ncbi:RNA-binding protein [Streptococcus suis]|uniref:YlmH family RNA-binding protein n=1 Tax=Streptococcus suis TaxID=1307 RepID=UPI000CF59D88|nr:YlmH/Sll1252 family protein [Streptococcus suis]
MRKVHNILQHFTKDEKDFAEKIIDICQQVEETYSYRLTPFINPRQEKIASQIANYFQLSFYSTGSITQFEYSRVIIAPDYYELDYSDFEVMALGISYSRKFHQITHSQVLGSFLNQLGIKREFLGDIIVSPDELFVFIDQKFGQLALQSINKIAKVPVNISEKVWTSIQIEENVDRKSKEVLVSSLRLDKLIASTFNISRTSATKLIESGQVKLDYVTIEQVSKIVEIGQLISVRKFGRIHLREFLGFSKQGKVKLKLDIVKT